MRAVFLIGVFTTVGLMAGPVAVFGQELGSPPPHRGMFGPRVLGQTLKPRSAQFNSGVQRGPSGNFLGVTSGGYATPWQRPVLHDNPWAFQPPPPYQPAEPYAAGPAAPAEPYALPQPNVAEPAAPYYPDYPYPNYYPAPMGPSGYAAPQFNPGYEPYQGGDEDGGY